MSKSVDEVMDAAFELGASYEKQFRVLFTSKAPYGDKLAEMERIFKGTSEELERLKAQVRGVQIG